MEPSWMGRPGPRGRPPMIPPQYGGPGPPPYSGGGGGGPPPPYGAPPPGDGGPFFEAFSRGPGGPSPPWNRGGRGRGAQLPPHPGGGGRGGGGGGRRGRKRQHHQQQQHPQDGLGPASLNELRQENRRKTKRHFDRAPPQQRQPLPSPRIGNAPAAPHNDNAYLLSHHQSGGAFIDAVARTPTKDPLSTFGGRLTPSNYVPGDYWTTGFNTAEDREAAEVEDAEALGHAGASMGLLGYLGPASDASDDDSSDHGLSEESEEGEGVPQDPTAAGAVGGRLRR